MVIGSCLQTYCWFLSSIGSLIWINFSIGKLDLYRKREQLFVITATLPSSFLAATGTTSELLLAMATTLLACFDPAALTQVLVASSFIVPAKPQNYCNRLPQGGGRGAGRAHRQQLVVEVGGGIRSKWWPGISSSLRSWSPAAVPWEGEDQLVLDA